MAADAADVGCGERPAAQQLDNLDLFVINGALKTPLIIMKGYWRKYFLKHLSI